MDFENPNGKKIHQTKVKDFGNMFVNTKKNSKIFGKKSMASPRFDKSLENRDFGFCFFVTSSSVCCTGMEYRYSSLHRYFAAAIDNVLFVLVAQRI
jgi:hypothetical protein